MNNRIVPVPKKIVYNNEGICAFYPATIRPNQRFAAAIDVFCRYADKVGVSFQVKQDARIFVEEKADLASGAYTIKVDKEQVILLASDIAGMNHAFASVLQMMEIGTDGQQIGLPDTTVAMNACYGSIATGKVVKL